MKGLFRAALVLTGAATVALSCNKGDAPNFWISLGNVWVIQDNLSNPGQPSFIPYAYFVVGGDELDYGEALIGGLPMSGGSFHDNVFEAVSQPLPQLDMVNGRYDFEATSVKGETAGGAAYLNFPETGAQLGSMTVDNFSYSSGTLSASIGKVDNATHYGFLVSPIEAGVPEWSMIESIQYIGHSATGASTESVSLSFSPTGYERWRAWPIAIYDGRSKGQGLIILKGAMRIINKGTGAFE